MKSLLFFKKKLSKVFSLNHSSYDIEVVPLLNFLVIGY